jgi:hypothetical protein
MWKDEANGQGVREAEFLDHGHEVPAVGAEAMQPQDGCLRRGLGLERDLVFGLLQPVFQVDILRMWRARVQRQDRGRAQFPGKESNR